MTVAALALRSGLARANLTNLHWSWFDQDDVALLTSPTDTGTAETTDSSGNLAVLLANTSLTTGQYGRLFLETSDKVSLGHYRLAIP